MHVALEVGVEFGAVAGHQVQFDAFGVGVQPLAHGLAAMNRVPVGDHVHLPPCMPGQPDQERGELTGLAAMSDRAGPVMSAGHGRFSPSPWAASLGGETSIAGAADERCGISGTSSLY